MRSGVLVPFPFPWEDVLEDCDWDCGGILYDEARIVVLRVACVVSADGGGGRLARMEEAGRKEARQRKHSPVP